MSIVDRIIKQLQDCTGLFQTQSGLLQPDQLAAIVQSLATSLKSQIMVATIDVAGATALTQAIISSSFPDETKRVLTAAVNLQVTAGPTPAGSGKNQHCANVLCYFTAADWKVFEDPTRHINVKYNRLVERCRLLGFVHPSEEALKYLLGVVAAVHCPDADGQTLYGMVNSLKQIFATTRGVRQGHVLHTYPATPADLSHDHFAVAYSDLSDPPVAKEPPHFAMVVAKTPLRSSNKHVSTRPGSRSSGSTDVAPWGGGQGLPSNMSSMQLLSMMLENMPACRRSMEMAHGSQHRQDIPIRVLRQNPNFSNDSQTSLGDSQSPSPEAKTPRPTSGLLALPPPSALQTAPPVQQPLQDSGPLDTMNTKADEDRIALLEKLAAKPEGTAMKRGFVMKKLAGTTIVNAKSEPAKGRKHVKAEAESANDKKLVKGKVKAESATSKELVKGKVKAEPAKGEKHVKGKVKVNKKHVKGKVKVEPAKGKKHVKGKAKVEPAEGTKHGKRPAAGLSGALVLGCAKCRRSPLGCGQCRDPAFTGRRGVA